MSSPLHGLVLAGGASTRMQRDKAALDYHGRPQLVWTFDLVSTFCARSFVSVRPEQAGENLRSAYPQIVDAVDVGGPIAGILSALLAHRDAAWLVLACDLPFVDRATLEHLVRNRDTARVSTAYRSAHDSLPEPLCAIFEPHALGPLQAHVSAGQTCPRKFLIRSSDALIIDLPQACSLDNVNTIEEWAAARSALSRPAAP